MPRPAACSGAIVRIGDVEGLGPPLSPDAAATTPVVELTIGLFTTDGGAFEINGVSSTAGFRPPIDGRIDHDLVKLGLIAQLPHVVDGLLAPPTGATFIRVPRDGSGGALFHQRVATGSTAWASSN